MIIKILQTGHLEINVQPFLNIFHGQRNALSFQRDVACFTIIQNNFTSVQDISYIRTLLLNLILYTLKKIDHYL